MFSFSQSHLQPSWHSSQIPLSHQYLTSNMCCNGCREIYSAHGLQSHLLQTNDPICKEEFCQQNHAHVADIDEDNCMDIDDDDEPLQRFEGDFFGDDYGLDYFEHFGDNQSLSDSGDSDLDKFDSNLDFDHEHGWEPEVPPLAPPPEPEDNEGDAEEEVGSSTRYQQSTTLKNMAPHIEYFNDIHGRQAGVPVPNNQDTLSFHDEYKANFNSTYFDTPFKSKLDWKMAQWAKTRGPGSMAFSELLSIPGICVNE